MTLNSSANNLLLPILRRDLLSINGLNSPFLWKAEKVKGHRYLTEHYDNTAKLQKLKERCHVVITQRTAAQKVDVTDSGDRFAEAANEADLYEDEQLDYQRLTA
ncbi:MAG TPA: hypothetical protein VF598_05850 [Hymenobacter sp.]|jgi:hypothetical protein